MDDDDAATGNSAASVTLSDRDLKDAKRILARIARADDRRRITHGAREIRSERDNPMDRAEKLAMQVFAVQEARRRLLPEAQSADPAWDLLVALYLADKSGVRHTIGRMIELSGASATTGLRHIDLLEAAGLVIREQDKNDRRSFFLLLSSKGRRAVDKVFSQALRA